MDYLVWGPDIASRAVGGAGSNWQAAGGVGGLLFVVDGSSVSAQYPASNEDAADDNFFPLMDRLGNVLAYAKVASATTPLPLRAVYDYDAFGRELRSSGSAADLVPFHFSTKFTDQESSLNYYGYRYYDSGKGRWLSRDPIGVKGGANLYGILGNNMLANTDILGLTEQEANIGAYDHSGNAAEEEMFSNQHRMLSQPSQGLSFSNANDLIEQLKKIKKEKECCLKSLSIQGHAPGVAGAGGIIFHGAGATREQLQGAGDGERLGKGLASSMCKPCRIILLGCAAAKDEEFVRALAKSSGCFVVASKANNETTGNYISSRFGVKTWSNWNIRTEDGTNFHYGPPDGGPLWEIPNSSNVANFPAVPW